MIPIVAERSAELESLCRHCSVSRLELFGSAATGMFGRSVDLVDNSAIKNPYLRESIDEAKVLVYAA